MKELVLRSERFRAEREADWRRLERLLERAEKSDPRELSVSDMLDMPRLYRSALSALSMARSISLDQGLIDYLEALCARAYFFVYGERASLRERVGRFFREDWPKAVASVAVETAIAFGLMITAALVAAILVLQDPDWFYSFIPSDLAGGRDPGASTEELRRTLFGGPEDDAGLSAFSTFLFTHNAQVAITAFALGFALGVPTAFLMMYNGCILGAFAALFASRGLGIELGGWLLIHGATELFAVALAGAAGFRIGTAIVFPKEETRLSAAISAGRQAAPAIIGVILMLFVAGVLEGVARQVIELTWLRYLIAVGTFVLWCAYFYLPRRRIP